jgi:general secretion pathway protein D
VMTVTATNDRLRPLNEGVPIAIAPNGDPILSPIVDSIFAETTVSAVSGQTVVLSGLITKSDSALHRRVPILADIPLLGELFKFDSVSTQRKELLIVLTPHVVRSRFESDMVKQVESARMSWCLSDAIDIHGPVGLRSRNDPAGAAESETIYPEPIPAESFMPSPAGPESLSLEPQATP